MGVSVEEIVKRLVASDILNADDLAAVQSEAAEFGQSSEGEAFLKRLHKLGRITAYQAQALWKDKGDKLAFGNYVIEDELGRGGMGVVLKARHKRMQRHVAIKVLSAKLVKDAGAIARFQREVVAAAQLTHTNIVGAFDADEVNGQHILVMEFVPGRDLSSVVKQQGRLTVEQAVDCVVQAARGLEFAHKRGVIHRDIKPANLLLDQNGIVKILDMGLARFSDSADVGTQAELTGSGTIMGTVDYMSPEQAISTKSADARSDIYSLGITLYYLLTGEPAYQGDSLMARMMAHANQPIPDLRQARPDVPESVQSVFAKMVAKRPEDRYPSMTAVLVDLERCLSGAPQGNLQTVLPSPAAESLSQVLTPSGITGSGVAIGAPTVGAATLATATRSVTAKPVAAAEKTLAGRPTSETLPSLPQAVRRRTGKARSKSKPTHQTWLYGVLAAGGLAMVLGAVILFWPTPQGTLRLEINDPEIEVSIKGTDLVLKGADPQPLTLSPGQKTLIVRRGDFQFETDRLVLKKNDTTTVKVELLAGAVRVLEGATVLGAGMLPTATTATTVATAPEVAPSPQSAPPIASKPQLETVDLLQWLPKDQNGMLTVGTAKKLGGAPRFFREVEVPESYVLELDLQRETGDGNTDINLIVGGRPCFVRLGGRLGDRTRNSGLGHLDELGPEHANNPTSRLAPMMRDNDWNRVVCTIKSDRVQVLLNGESLIDWTGNAERLNGHSQLLTSIKNVGLRLGLTQWEGRLRCRRAVLTAEAITILGNQDDAVPPGLQADFQPRRVNVPANTPVFHSKEYQSKYPKQRRWPLAPSAPEDIRWLHQELVQSLTLRLGADQDLVITPDQSLPTEPATIVGIVFRRDVNTKLTDDTLRRVATFADLEILELDFAHPGPSVTKAGLDSLGSLTHLGRLSLGRCGSGNDDFMFLSQLPELRSLRISILDFPGWMDRVKTLTPLQELSLYEQSLHRLEELAELPQLQELVLGGTLESINARRRRAVDMARVMPWLQITVVTAQTEYLEILDPKAPRPER